MSKKSYHQHQQEEKEKALSALSKAKSNDYDKVSIYLKDRNNTIVRIKKSKLNKQLELLKEQGKIIKQVL